MKQILCILFLLWGISASSQCVFNESHVISPGGVYSPGQTVTVWYTLGAFNAVGPFIISFQVTVDSVCTAEDLSISIEVFDDCTTGGWSNGACCVDPAYDIYNGIIQITPTTTSNINHF